MQTSIQAEGFRSLREAEPVEYELEAGEDGRAKAIKVTGPGGAPPLVSCRLESSSTPSRGHAPGHTHPLPFREHGSYILQKTYFLKGPAYKALHDA